MNLNPGEKFLRMEHVHKSIFCLPAFLVLLPLIPGCAFFFIIALISQKTNEVFNQLSGQPSPTGLFFLPLVILAVP